MNDILVVGSVALDTVKTPFGEAKEALGGSATYASYAASFFTSVRMVGVVGEDFPKEHIALLKDRFILVDRLQLRNTHSPYTSRFPLRHLHGPPSLPSLAHG